MYLDDIIRRKKFNNHFMKKSTFFVYLNRRTDFGFTSLLSKGEEDQDYINWNDFFSFCRHIFSDLVKETN